MLITYVRGSVVWNDFKSRRLCFGIQRSYCTSVAIGIGKKAVPFSIYFILLVIDTEPKKTAERIFTKLPSVNSSLATRTLLPSSHHPTVQTRTMKLHASLTLFLGVLASASGEFIRKVEEPTQLHDVMFQTWSHEHEKEYSTDAEKEFRMQIWMQNHREYH